MSLLDTLGSLMGGNAQGGNPQALASAALEFVNNQPGGLNGLIQRFHENGAGDIINSWVGNGDNQPISSDMVHSVLGSDVVANLAAKAGVDPQQAGSMLAQLLPHVVNSATPQGEVPADGKLNSDTVLGALGGLASLFGGKQA